MRLVFVGASKFGLRCMRLAIELPETEVVGIITSPPIFTISYRPSGVRNVLHADVHAVARERGIPVWDMTGSMTDPALISQVRAWRPDFILVAGWYHMIPRIMRDIAPAAGLHASLLPDYSGGAPLVWAIINGEERTGITFFLMADGVDDGPIIGQTPEPIHLDDTIATLYARIEEAGLALLREHLPKIARGEAAYTPQDNGRRRLVPQRGAEDGLIDWTWPALRVYNFVRAQTRPYPGAFTFARGEKFTVWTSRLPTPREPQDACGLPPGIIIMDTPRTLGVWVACGDDTRLLLTEAEWAGEQVTAGEIARRIGDAAVQTLGH